MEAKDIPVVSDETVATYRQVIRPRTQAQVADILALMFDAGSGLLRQLHWTGEVRLIVNQGGVRQIVTEESAAEGTQWAAHK